MAARRTRPSWSALPMFVEAPHRALGEMCDRVLVEEDVALHAADRVVPRLAELGLLSLLVPRDGERVDVRSLCIAREAIAYLSPMADSIFAVQGLGSHPILLAGEAARLADVLRKYL